jgi:hypothetical protein
MRSFLVRLLCIAVIAFVSGCSESAPNLSGVIENGGVTITSDEDGVVTIQRMLINGRNGDRGCDFEGKYQPDRYPGTYWNFPVTLKRGDFTHVMALCGRILQVTVYTDKGDASLNFDD